MANNYVFKTISTNLATSPWYDDYDPTKGFYKITWKPSLAVQARELTQSQTILQNQISRFAENIFQEGSLVTGGQFNFDENLCYVKILDNNTTGEVNINNFADKVVRGVNSEVEAQVLYIADGNELAANTKTLFIKYTASGNNSFNRLFLDNETIYDKETNYTATTSEVGLSSAFTIEAGVVFAKGYFVKFDKQSIILDRYSSSPSVRVGFLIDDYIVTYQDDYTLLDPARGSYNYAAPGADRLKIDAKLTKISLNDNIPDNFVTLFNIKDGIIQSKVETTQYSVIRDELAKRTFDESGDYYVNGLDVRIREHLNDGTNQGYLTDVEGGNTQLLAIGIEPGKAYVKGYDIQTLVPTYISTRKGIDTNQLDTQNLSTNYGNYVEVKEVVGSWNFNSPLELDLYDTAQQKITNRTYASAASGTKIGTAKFKAIELESGVMGNADATYRLYLYDIIMTNGDFGSVKAVWKGSNSAADIILNSGSAILQDTNFNNSIYQLPSNAVKSIRDSGGNVQTSYTFFKSYDVVIATNGTFVVSTGLSDEIFENSVGSLNTTQKEEYIVTVNSTTSSSMAGTVTLNSGNATVVGSGTSFTNLNVNDTITVTGHSGIFRVSAISNNTSMTLVPTPSSSVSGAAWSKYYSAGQIIDYTGKGGAAGASRTINVNTSTSATFDMKETLSSSATATVTVRLVKTTAKEASKIIKKNRYVIVDCSTAGTTGPFNLGLCDVTKLHFVRKGTSFTTDDDGTDVTSLFIMDNGQRNNVYEHAKLVKIGGSLTSGDKLLVKLDYFAHDYSQGVGYYSIDSYPIDDTNSANTNAITTKEIPLFGPYNLRNCIDTRVTKAQTATDATSIGSASTNPSESTTYESPLGGIHTTLPDQNFILSYSYYLPRKDLITLNKYGEFRIIEGVPFTTPVTPQVPDDSMSIATLLIKPYPSLSPFVSSQIARSDLSCSVNKTAYIRYTMRDIGVIKNRVDNLEYYVSLNSLQQSSIDMKIVDGNGLDRFKNGIFVDPFNSHVLGNIGNADYNISVDPGESCIRPIFELDDIKLTYQSGSNVKESNGIVTLDYSEEIMAEQPYATTNRNTASQYWKFVGEMILDPDQDFWVNTQQNPDVQIDLSGQNQIWANVFNNSAWSTVWNDWQTVWTGTQTVEGDLQTRNFLNGEDITGASFGGGANMSNQTFNQFLGFQAGTHIDLVTQDVSQIVTTEQTRTGSVNNISLSSVTQSLGNNVIDTSLIPYIRPQIIKIYIYGLKSNTRFYTYFDDEAMSDFCTQTNSSFITTKSEGDPLISDNNGELHFLLRIPTTGKQFRVGTKKVRVTDSITNELDAMSTAEAYFVAQGLNQQKQNTILTTSIPTLTTQSTSENRTLTSSSTQNNVISLNSVTTPGLSDPNGGGGAGDPIAQTFMFNLPDTVSGIFLTSIDLFFQQIDQFYNIKVELREVDSAGNITNSVIPYGESIKLGSTINTSEDGTVATNFQFKGPVYLLNNTQYAFVIKPESNNPNFYIWTAKLGENDVKTNFRVTSQPYIGVMFVSANNMTWDSIQDEDIKFRLYRAKFLTNTNGSATFKNDNIEYFKIDNYTSLPDMYGEIVEGQTRVTLSNVSGGSVANTYIINGVTSTANGQIDLINGTVFRIKNHDHSKPFIVGEDVTINYANNAISPITAKINTQTWPYGTIQLYDAVKNQLKLFNSSGNFQIGEKVIGSISGTSFDISDMLPIKYSTVDYVSSYLSFPSTTVNWDSKSVSNTNIIDASYSPIQVNDNTYLSTEKIVLGNSMENSLLSGNKSMNVRSSLFSVIDYLSPVIDLNRTHAITVHNIVNNDETGEDGTFGGNCINKYISTPVSLADGQDAEDMNLYITAYHPPGTTISVYCKFLAGEDSDNFSTRNWIKMELKSGEVFSSTANNKDYKEFQYGFPTSMLTGPNGAVQYTNSRSVTFSDYKYFTIKICLMSINSAVVPKVSDLRVIALQR